MEGFGAFLRIVRKTGPQPFWTPVAPLHRVVSYPLSWIYCALGLTPLKVTILGLLVAYAGVALLALNPLATAWFYVGLALLNLGSIHDACDGEVARYRLHKGLQSTATYRVGMFADFWAYTVQLQALVPLTLGLVAWRNGLSPWLAVLGAVACFAVLVSYVAGFARSAYWPEHRSTVREESFSFAAGAGPLVRFARTAYFQVFETAMFCFHATLVLLAWGWVGGEPLWATLYVAAAGAGLLAAFSFATARTLATFDQPPA